MEYGMFFSISPIFELFPLVLVGFAKYAQMSMGLARASNVKTIISCLKEAFFSARYIFLNIKIHLRLETPF